MGIIGVVFPKQDKKESLWKRIFAKNKFEFVFVREYGIEFLCMYDNQNYVRVFEKNGVENIVLLTDKKVAINNVRILDGERMYRKMLPEFVRKTAKSFDGKCTVAVVDKGLTDAGVRLTEQLCSYFETVVICTEKTYDAQRVCDRLLDEMGVVIEVVEPGSHIGSDIVVVLENCKNSYDPESIIIDKNCKTGYKKLVNDFYIPFNAKPPFGMSNLVFAECIDAVNK